MKEWLRQGFVQDYYGDRGTSSLLMGPHFPLTCRASVTATKILGSIRTTQRLSSALKGKKFAVTFR